MAQAIMEAESGQAGDAAELKIQEEQMFQFKSEGKRNWCSNSGPAGGRDSLLGRGRPAFGSVPVH